MDARVTQRTPAHETPSLPITLSPNHPITQRHPITPVRLLYFSPTGAHSSVGQSARFTSVRSQVQVLLRPLLSGYRLSAPGYWLCPSSALRVVSLSGQFLLDFPASRLPTSHAFRYHFA